VGCQAAEYVEDITVVIDLLLPSTNEGQVKTISSDRRTILLAEDEEVHRLLISMVLQKEGFDILVAANGKEAIEHAERHQGRIHLLLTDVSMPEVEGPILARSLQAIWRDLKVIVMSADPAKVLSLDQSWTFIRKPFLVRFLVQRIREALPQSPKFVSEHRQKGPLLRVQRHGIPEPSPRDSLGPSFS
jgi:DNA-binding response OmpR family regulator